MAFDLELFVQSAERVREKALQEKRIYDNPTEEKLRTLLAQEPGIQKTIYGSFVAESEPTSRSQMFTKNSVDSAFGADEKKLLDQCERVLAGHKLICVDRVVGNPQSGITVRLIVPVRFAHIAYGGTNLFYKPVQKINRPTYYIVFFYDDKFESNKSKSLPEKDITIRLAMLPDGRYVKIVRNGNYIGEYKKGVFAAEDWASKTRRGGIFLHAGCREDSLQSSHGNYRTVRTLLTALSANGKTTTTSRILARKGMEKSWLVQDDGGTLMPDGSFLGYEAGGIFVKTEGVNPGEQTEIFYGLLRPETVCENVHITKDGDFDFYNLERTSNGRAVIKRQHFMHASRSIDVDHIDNFIMITRHPLVPAISKVTQAQATALMILGQAMESSAGDPTQAGKIRSEFFYDPFVAGSLAEHANIFYEITKGMPNVNYYLLNTGGIGEGDRYWKIQLPFTMGILDSLIRGGLEDWEESPTGFMVPKAIRVVDDIYVHPEKLYPAAEYEQKQKELNHIRYEAVRNITGGLNKAVRKVFEKA